MHCAAIPMNQSASVQLPQNPHDATGAMHILHVINLGIGRHLHQVRHFTGNAVNVRHGEIHLTLLRYGQQVQHRVGGPTHGHIQRHGVFKGLKGGDAARQDRLVILLVVAFGDLHNLPSRPLKQLAPILMSGQHGTIARQSQPQSLHQTVHRVGGEHAGAGTTRRTSTFLHLLHGLIRAVIISSHDHGIHQIQLDFLPA